MENSYGVGAVSVFVDRCNFVSLEILKWLFFGIIILKKYGSFKQDLSIFNNETNSRSYRGINK